MKSLPSLFSLLAVLTLLAAPSAEARFGKASSSKSSKKSEKGERKSKSAPSKRTHGASAVRSGSSRSSGQVHAASRPRPEYQVEVRRPRPRVRVHGHLHAGVVVHDPVYVAPAYRTQTYQTYAQPQVEQQVAPVPEPGYHHRFEAGVTGRALKDGGVAGVQVGFDWHEWGMEARYDLVSLRADDGSGAVDRIGLFNTTATWSLVSNERGRLRLHGGVYSAFAPDITFVGPGVGASTQFTLFGPFTADAGAHLVVLPFTQVDAYAAAGLKLWIAEARAGFRFTALDDQGRVDGVRHTDVLAGPYLGLSLVL